jgi:hypothetical protein
MEYWSIGVTGFPDPLFHHSQHSIIPILLWRSRWPTKTLKDQSPASKVQDKVSGKMRYAADLDFPNALAAKDFAHVVAARKILSIDTSKALKLNACVAQSLPGADVGGVWSAAHERHAACSPPIE